MNIHSIYTRLIFGYTLLVVFASIAFGTFTYINLRSHLYSEMQLTLARRIEHIRKDVLASFDDGDLNGLDSLIDQIYSPKESNRFIRISKEGDGLVYLSGIPQDGSFNPKSVIVAPYKSISSCESGVTSNFYENLMVLGCRAKIKQSDYVIEMGIPVYELEQVLHQFFITLVLGLAVITALAILGGGFLVKLALSPVEAIRSSAEKITYGNVSQRLPKINSGDPIQHLSETLNQMLDRLETAYQNASRFSSDVSHELRTPLTIIRNELETLQKDKALSGGSHERLGSILEEVERLSDVVESLLVIARLEAGEARAKNDLINLSELVRSSIEQMQLLADEKNISVNIYAESPVLVSGDAARLKQMIVNLFDNSIKYTPNHGLIDISVFVENGVGVLLFKDNGIGISAEELPHIFERFYRADKVRSSSSQGTGLGLYIVRAICQAHGGMIDVKSVEGNGTLVEIKLPLKTSNDSDN